MLGILRQDIIKDRDRFNKLCKTGKLQAHLLKGSSIFTVTSFYFNLDELRFWTTFDGRNRPANRFSFYLVEDSRVDKIKKLEVKI